MPRTSARRRAGGLRIGRRGYWILTAAALVILIGTALWRGQAVIFTWNTATAFRLLALLLAAFAPFTLLYAARLRDIGRSNWWALLIPTVTLGLLFAGLNLGFSLQRTMENWPFSRTLLILQGTLALSASAWLAPTIWLGARPSRPGGRA